MSINLSQNKEQCLNEKIKLKQCQFPGCEIHFEGRGLEKYCTEHRKKEYYKDLYFNRYKQENKESISELKKNNQIIKHKSCDAFTVKSICALRGCNHKFDIQVTPGNFVYPKFCPEHRNEFQREQFLKKMYKRLADKPFLTKFLNRLNKNIVKSIKIFDNKITTQMNLKMFNKLKIKGTK